MTPLCGSILGVKPAFLMVTNLRRTVLEKLRRGPGEEHIHILSVCAPNYLHDAHCRLELRVGADVICEKPLVINPWGLDALQELEAKYGKRKSARVPISGILAMSAAKTNTRAP